MMVLRLRHWCFIIFGLAFLLRIAGVVATHQYYNLDRFEMERTALSLAFTGVFGNPYAIPTGPSAHVSPAYAVILAAIFRIFGTGVPGEAMKQAIACAVTALQCALMPVVAKRFGLSELTGLLAGFAAALLPLKFSTETQGDWESNWAALALMLVAILTVTVWERGDFTVPEGIQAGLGWGLALLFAWVFFPLFVVILVCGFVVARRVPYLRYSAVAVGCVALCLAPWVVRNWFAFHAFIPGRTNTGIELRISNNDYAEAREEANFKQGVYHRFHPLQSVGEARKVLALGEVEYNKSLTAEAAEWIRAHPGKFLRLTAARFGLYWFYPDREHLPKTAILWMRTLLGLIGLAVLWRVNAIGAAVLSLILVVVPLPNYLVHVALKHSYQLDWVFTLLAAFTVSCALERKSPIVTARRR